MVRIEHMTFLRKIIPRILKFLIRLSTEQIIKFIINF